jgi:hypothetical protein
VITHKKISDKDTDVQKIITAYQAVCNSYHAIDDFRAKLLGLLPLASGAGIFLVLEKFDLDKLSSETKSILTAVGMFGFLITLGLFSYEIYGIKKCAALIEVGKRMEELMEIKNGQFIKRPQRSMWFINEPFASAIIYSTVMAMWAFFCLHFNYSGLNPHVPIFVFVYGFVGTIIYDFQLQRHFRPKKEVSKKIISA